MRRGWCRMARSPPSRKSNRHARPHKSWHGDDLSLRRGLRDLTESRPNRWWVRTSKFDDARTGDIVAVQECPRGRARGTFWPAAPRTRPVGAYKMTTKHGVLGHPRALASPKERGSAVDEIGVTPAGQRGDRGHGERADSSGSGWRRNEERTIIGVPRVLWRYAEIFERMATSLGRARRSLSAPAAPSFGARASASTLGDSRSHASIRSS